TVLALDIGPGGLSTAWDDSAPAGSDDDRLSVKLQRFSNTGARLSFPRQVNDFTANDQTFSDITALPDGRFLAVWASRFSDGGDAEWSIRAKFLSDDLFADGFESGDTDAWDQRFP
ncbi:MAG: hypothetical protein AAGF23_15860, partial [Acidobacteriota bacterium]